MSKIIMVSKARQLYDILKQEIAEKKYVPGDKIPSIRDLSEAYGLSKNTVNTVIAMLVNDGLLTIHEGMGTYVAYEPKKVRMIGVMLFDFSVGMRVDTGILEAVQKNITSDYYLSLADTSNRYDSFCDGLERLLDMGASGLLIIPPKDTPTSGQLTRAKKLLARCPVVFMNRGIEGIEGDVYSMALGKGIENAMAYFATSGKRKTALVLHDSDKFVREELAAYESCAKLFGFEQRPGWLIPWSEDMERIREAVLPILSEIDSLIAPDTVFTALQEAIAQSGRGVPGSLSLVGINDTLVSRLFNPPLTSIVFPVERIGRHSITKLIHRIEQSEERPCTVTNFAPELIIRST